MCTRSLIIIIVLFSEFVSAAFAAQQRQQGIPYTWPGPQLGLENITDAVQVAAGNRFSVVLRANGRVTVVDDSGGFFMPPAGLTNIMVIAAAPHYIVALRADGQIIVWGNRTYSGSASRTLSLFNPPRWLTNAVTVRAGQTVAGALTSDGYLISWGADNYLDPPAIPYGLRHAVDFTYAQNFGLAITAEGEPLGWEFGRELGYNGPKLGKKVKKVSAGLYGHAAVLLEDGTVRCWGANNAGQTNTPSGLSSVIQIATGQERTLALKSDGRVVGWGAGPLAPSVDHRFFAIAAGQNHNIGILGVPASQPPR